ncbi:MAG: hypothetical protein ACRD0U_09455, partial [Acidimicrobiales bacterium]
MSETGPGISVVDAIWRSPLARFTVHSIGQNRRVRVDGAVAPAGVVWQPAGPGEEARERSVARHPDSLAAVLAGIIGLGPRPDVLATTDETLTW